MSPAKFVGDNYEQATTREIIGPRPTPLTVNRGSHAIQKPSSSYSDRQQRQHPVIIYAHSPKVIHTKPRDFMALVQKLTGLSRSDDDDKSNNNINGTPPNHHQSGLSTMSEEVRDHETEAAAKLDQDNESSSGLTDDENSGGGGGGSVNISGLSSSLSPYTVPNQFLADIPLFTPNSTNFFFSPSPIPLYRYADHSLFPSPNMANTISPSIFEAKKELPQH